MNPRLHPAVTGLIITAFTVLGSYGIHTALNGDYSLASSMTGAASKSVMIKPPISPEPPPKLSEVANILHHAYAKPETYGPSKANAKTYAALTKTIQKSVLKYNASAPESFLTLDTEGLSDATEKLLVYVLDKGLQTISEGAALIVTLADKNTFAQMLSEDASAAGGKGIDGKKRTAKQWKQVAAQEWNKKLQTAYSYSTGATDENGNIVVHLILFKGAFDKLSPQNLIEALVHELVHIKGGYAMYGAGESVTNVAPLLTHTTKMFHDTALSIVKNLK